MLMTVSIHVRPERDGFSFEIHQFGAIIGRGHRATYEDAINAACAMAKQR
jgi:hypothetical protein